MLPLIIGQTYYLSIKIHHALSAVNGTECELVSIVPGNGRPSALVVRIRAPSVPFQMRMLPPNCLLLLPHTATFSVAISLLAGCKVEGPITVQRTQFALVYGTAITAHKHKARRCSDCPAPASALPGGATALAKTTQFADLFKGRHGQGRATRAMRVRL